MMQVAVYGCGYGIIGVIGVDCCLCMGTGVESALTSTATSRSQSSRSARLLPVGASSPNSVKIDSASRKARNTRSHIAQTAGVLRPVTLVATATCGVLSVSRTIFSSLVCRCY